MNYKIEISAFEGPMDLLLHLINKDKIDIYDIPIQKITDQFLDYIQRMKDLNLEVASEFLLMASSLIEIKSKMLLPKEEKLDKNEEELDPREELVNRLIEYQKYKEVSEELKSRKTKHEKIYYKPKEDIFDQTSIELPLEDMDVKLLLKAVNNIIKEKSHEDQILTINEIQKEEYSLDQCILIIKNSLEEKDSLSFSQLLGSRINREKVITYFLSILELTKDNYITIEQKEDFSDLIIKRRFSKDESN